MSEWRVIQDLARPPAEQMPADVRLAHEGLPTLRLFTWNRPAVSLGWKQAVPPWLDESVCRQAGVAIVERPTGGGIAFHGSDLSWSVTIPDSCSLSMHRAVECACDVMVKLCEAFNVNASSLLDVERHTRITVCLAELSPYAIMVGSKKLAGMAVRRFKTSWLLQGSMLISELPAPLRRVVPVAIRAALDERATTLSRMVGEPVNVATVAQRWADHWSAWWPIDELVGV